MKKVSIGFVGLSAAASSALVQSVVDQLAPEGTVMIDRDENGADITVFDEGERFLLPETKLAVEDGVATIECDFAGDLRTGFDEVAREWEGKDMADAADLPDLDLRSWEPRKAFDGIGEAWLIELSGNRFLFNRLIGGEVNESYRPMETDEALLAAVSVIQGFQPPRHLYRLDKPAG